MAPSASRKPEKRADLLGRLQAVSAVARVNADEIVDGLFPAQASYLVASRLLSVAGDHACLKDSKGSQCSSEPPLLSPPRSRRRKRRTNHRTLTLLPLQPQPSRSYARVETVMTHAELALVLWDSKMDRRQLSCEDSLFLLLREDTICVLESARLLRASRVSYEQATEIELTLESIRSDNTALRSNVGSHRHLSLASMLTRNVWMSRKAFAARHSTLLRNSVTRTGDSLSMTAQDLQVVNATAKVRTHPGARIVAREQPRCDYLGLRSRPPTKQLKQITTSGTQDAHAFLTTRLNAPVAKAAEYLRIHCVEELIHRLPSSSLPLSSPPPLSSSLYLLRRRFAVEKLIIVVSRHHQKTQDRCFRWWREQVCWWQCRELVEAFCKLKCALWVLRRARRQLQSLVSRCWRRWEYNSSEQEELEHLAALITIQSWRRQVIGKRKAASHAVQQAATTIQSRWRGFYDRKMFVRRRRYVQFSQAAVQIQRCYHSFRFRQQIAEYTQRMRAARVITRSLRAFLKKRHDFRAWCVRLARYHATIAIQTWCRRQRALIERKRRHRERVEAAGRILAKFFRWARFMRRFGSRVQRLLDSRARAAVKLQSAYRAKIARARFYELLDRLEEQRRLDILQNMWENAYASTIQTWWRRRRDRRGDPALIQ